jgi:hypothetical protein
MQAVAPAGALPAEVDTAPDEAWAALFLGEGFDPVDGAHRVRVLARAQGSLYASVREGGRTVAAGAMAFGHGWASVHGMRTDAAQRGHGLAGRVLAGLARVERSRAGVVPARRFRDTLAVPLLAAFDLKLQAQSRGSSSSPKRTSSSAASTSASGSSKPGASLRMPRSRWSISSTASPCT